MSAVHHPKHYNLHPSGVECIDLIEWLDFSVGSAIKYLWRCGLKGDEAMQELEKAVWYFRRALERDAFTIEPNHRREVMALSSSVITADPQSVLASVLASLFCLGRSRPAALQGALGAVEGEILARKSVA